MIALEEPKKNNQNGAKKRSIIRKVFDFAKLPSKIQDVLDEKY